jgi:hypothetical protein
MTDPRVNHFWDERALAGTAFAPSIDNLQPPAWDVWMLFAPGVIWGNEGPPEPDWWEHQLGALKHLPERRLDPSRFALKAVELSMNKEVRDGL